MKNECYIVKDLLNSYDDGTLSETSKKFVENHLTGCENCKQILNEIKKQNNDASIQEIDYLKKIRKKLSIKNFITIVLSIIILLLILLDVLLFYNYYKKMSVINQNNAIISSLKLNAEKYENLDNYSYTLTVNSPTTNGKKVIKYYVLGNAFVTEVIRYTDEGNEVHEYAYYPGIDDDIIYVINNGQKLISIYKEYYSYLFDVSPCKLTYLGDMIYNQEIVKIEDDTPDKNYYTIISAYDVYAYNADNVYKDYRKYIVEKDTGIIVKAISDNFTYSIEYEIENVTNEDIDRIANILNVNENTTLSEYLG